MKLFGRRPRLPQIGETEAYDRAYGEPLRDVRIVKLEPRRPRYSEVLADGERLRKAFLAKLDNREKEVD